MLFLRAPRYRLILIFGFVSFLVYATLTNLKSVCVEELDTKLRPDDEKEQKAKNGS